MEHFMRLNPIPFKKINEGKKTIELRLYDEKRQAVKAGDIICFSNSKKPEERLKALVEKIYIFDSFEDLYKSLPLEECGYDKEEAAYAKASDMNKYYSKEERQKYGAVGIKISKLPY